MLWQVHGTEMYLLGSVHILDSSLLTMTPEMEAAYSAARRIAVEADFTAPLDFSPWLLPETDRLSQRIEPQLFAAAAIRWAEAGLEPTLLERMPPWFAALMLIFRLAAARGISDRNGVDLYFLTRGRSDSKEVITLEPLSSGLDAFASGPMPEQMRFLSYAAEDAEASQAEVDSMISAWRAGQLRYFEQFLERRFRLAPQMFDALVNQRNHAWMPQLLAIADDQVPTLVVVGALHCVGLKGLPALLGAAGRPVSPVG
jgi:uncharacterized protein